MRTARIILCSLFVICIAFLSGCKKPQIDCDDPEIMAKVKERINTFFIDQGKLRALYLVKGKSPETRVEIMNNGFTRPFWAARDLSELWSVNYAKNRIKFENYYSGEIDTVTNNIEYYKYQLNNGEMDEYTEFNLKRNETALSILKQPANLMNIKIGKAKEINRTVQGCGCRIKVTYDFDYPYDYGENDSIIKRKESPRIASLIVNYDTGLSDSRDNRLVFTKAQFERPLVK